MSLICLLIGAGFIGACGPVVSSVHIRDASNALNAAEKAGAKKDATYEYTMALQYLEKAREEAGYSDFVSSRQFADQALKFAIDAKKQAQQVSNQVTVDTNKVTTDTTESATSPSNASNTSNASDAKPTGP
ncbi:MAG: DUF4398 domain-containing protein [Deltaproteobacteria bacterium]|nr:DUF4398 domain-containing protein [Deltaproteobacteria bacterium]